VAILTELKDLIAKVLHLSTPWQIEKVEFIEEIGRLNIYVNFTRGAVFNCPSCGKSGAKAYATDIFEWRHLDFFQYQAYIIARVPRVDCKDGCGILKVNVPWARPSSGFTLLFDNKVMVLSREMPIATLGRICNEHDTKLWGIINHGSVLEFRIV
jgi:transposase